MSNWQIESAHYKGIEMNGLSTRRIGFSRERQRQQTRLQQRQQIVDKVASALADNYFPSLKRLEIEFNNNEIKLKGSVRTYHEKQIAYSLSQNACGDTKIVDEILVNSSN